MKKLLFIFLICLLPVFALAYTETFYVCEGGDGTLPETATCGTAWDSADFSTAGNWDSTPSAPADDGKIGSDDLVIILNDGGPITGSGGAVLISQYSGTSGNPITIQSESGVMSVIDGEDLITGISVGVDYMIIDGLEITDAGDSASEMGINNWGGDNLIVKNSKIHGSSASGIFQFGSNGLFQDNEVYSNGEHGIYLGGNANTSDNVIEYNYIYTNTSGNIQLNTGAGNPSDTIIRYNFLKDAGQQDINEVAGLDTVIHHNLFVGTITTNFNAIFVGDQDSGPPPERPLIYNNTFHGKWNRVINFSASNSTTCTFINNIVQQGDPAAYLMATVAIAPLVADNNVYYGGDSANAYFYNGSDYSFTNWKTQLGGCPNTGNDCDSSEEDPKLTSISDLTLQSDSPGIGSGDSNIGQTYDDGIDPQFNGSSDFGVDNTITLLDQDNYGSGWDVGAYVDGVLILPTMSGIQIGKR